VGAGDRRDVTLPSCLLVSVKGNFEALFEAIERDQQMRGNL